MHKYNIGLDNDDGNTFNDSYDINYNINTTNNI